MVDHCATAVVAEMNDWTNLGGTNLGIYGDPNHSYGFHRAANEVPATDYSRNHDPAGPNSPVNWNWATAGDFGHNGDPGLRARHATVLSRLMHDDPALSMICEFIGQPYADKPVYYWARWDGCGTLQQYTGSGHDRWSHISWWRSRADQRAYIWTGTPGPAPSYPPYPGYLMSYAPSKYDGNVKTWQQRMHDRGWTITADGYFGDQTLSVVRAFQQEKHLGVDGIIGPATWAAAWTAPVT